MKKSFWLFITVSILLVLILVDVSPLAAQDEANDPEANKAVLAAFFEAEAARDYDRMDEFMVDDFVRHSVATTAIMPGFEVTSLEQYVGFLQETAAMFPDYANTPQALIAEGDNVAFYGIFSGTFAENGNHIEVPIVGYARFDGGKVAELWVEWDNLTWNTQMMAEPVEQPISSVADVVGVWGIEIGGSPFHMEFKPDGTGMVVNLTGADGAFNDPTCPSCEERFNYVIEGGQMRFLTSELRLERSEMLYDVFVTKQGDTPLSLRFDSVGFDSMYERRSALEGKTLYPAEAATLATEDVLGTWQWHGQSFYFQFREDGTFRADQLLTHLETDAVEDLGTFQFDGTLLTLTSGETTRYCEPGEVGLYELALTESGQLQFVLQEDACAIRRAPSTNPQLFDRVD